MTDLITDQTTDQTTEREENSATPEINAENVKTKKTRTVSTSFLETIREKENLGVREFLETLVAYEVANPSESFKESITKYANSKKKTGISSTGAPDPNKAAIESIFENNLVPIQNAKLVKVTSSRKHKDDDRQMYSVKVEYPQGTTGTFYVDMTDHTQVQFYMSDGYGTIGAPVDIRPTTKTDHNDTVIIESMSEEESPAVQDSVDMSTEPASSENMTEADFSL